MTKRSHPVVSRRTLAAGLLLVLAAAPLPADQPADPPEPEPEEPRYAAVDEITVTALKREDELQQVPMSVVPLTEAEMESRVLRTTMDLAEQVPNLEMKSNFHASNPTIHIRGVGINDLFASASGTVSLYDDEIYLGARTSQVLLLFDRERLEVLRGPQGTLYGKNTTGGAINLVSKKPSGQRGGVARLNLGRFDQADVEAAYETPLGSSGPNALRVAAASNNRDGYTRNTFNGNDENDIEMAAGRALLRLAPAERIILLLKAHGDVNRGGMQQFENRGLINGADALGYVESPDPYAGAYDLVTHEDIDRYGASVTLDWLGERFSLTSISAYEQAKRDALEDTDASPNAFASIAYTDDSHQISQELRLTSSRGGRLEWIGGLYYLDEDLEVANVFDLLRLLRDLGVGFSPNGPFTLLQEYTQRTRSFAPFGQVDFRVHDRLTLRGGLRYTWERKDWDLDTAFVEPLFTIPLIDFDDDSTFGELSGEIGLAYQARPDVLWFATLSRGFKSGGFNGGALFVEAEATEVDPEFLNSLEVGVKSSLADRRVLLNASAFYYDYEDLQVFNVINLGGVPRPVLENASNARILGAEIDVRTRPVAPLSLYLGLGLLDAEYRDFILADGSDLSGNPMVSAPDWSLSSAASYTWSVGPGELTGHLDYSYRDDLFFDATGRPEIGTEAYGLLNARIALDLPERRYTVALWGKNLADEVYLTEVFDNAAFGSHKLAVGEPRTYGLELIVRR